MIKLKIEIKDGKTLGKCDAKKSTVEEITMMIAILEKYKQKMQRNFNELSVFSSDTGIKREYE